MHAIEQQFELADVLSWVLILITGVGLLVYLGAVVEVMPFTNSGKWAFFQWALFGGIPSSLATIVVGFFRPKSTHKRIARACGFFMFLLWLFLAIGVLPVS